MNRRIVIVTGASSGIGKEIARQLARQGDFPLLVARNREKLNGLERELGQGEAFPCDVTVQEDVQQLIQNVIAKYGRVDVLINNAGFGRFGGTLHIPMTDFSAMADTNYLGAVRLIKEVLPHMLKYGGGRIINIASVAGLTGIPNLSAYCASKFALIGFSEALQLEFAPRIRIGVLCPGPVQSPFFQGEDPNHLFPELIAGQLLDVHTVARHAVKLIERPRVKVIPSGMSWAMRLRHLAPDVYLWAMKKLYDTYEKKRHTYQGHEA